jgi:hypothetical protein
MRSYEEFLRDLKDQLSDQLDLIKSLEHYGRGTFIDGRGSANAVVSEKFRDACSRAKVESAEIVNLFKEGRQWTVYQRAQKEMLIRKFWNEFKTGRNKWF